MPHAMSLFGLQEDAGHIGVALMSGTSLELISRVNRVTNFARAQQ